MKATKQVTFEENQNQLDCIFKIMKSQNYQILKLHWKFKSD